MADITKELNTIMEAVYGEEVRGSIHDAIKLINDVGEKVITIGTAVTSEDSSIEGYFDESLYLNAETAILWRCNGIKWVSMGTFKGADGDDGASLTATSVKVGKTTTVTISNATTGETVTTFEVQDGKDGSGGGGGGASSWYDLDDKPFEEVGSDFKTDNNTLALDESVTNKLTKIPSDNGTKDQVLLSNGDGTGSWGDAPSGGHEMISTREAFEANTEPNKVVDAIVLKEWSNGLSKFVEFIMPANAPNNTSTGHSEILENIDDDAYLEFYYGLTLKSGSTDEYQKVTLASYRLGEGEDKGDFSVTTVETLDVPITCRIKVETF